MDSDDDGARATELEALEAIFPELRWPDRKNRFTFQLDLAVEPAKPVTVTFPAAEVLTVATPLAAPRPVANGQVEQDTQRISYLPSLSLLLTLPDGYPAELPPQAKISTSPQWLSSDVVARLEDDGPRLWEEAGRDMIAYTYIDHLQRAAEDVFGITTEDGIIEVDPAHKLAILDYDVKAKQASFERETFDCGICLEPKRGLKCHKMLDCGHVFCLQCLRDFYNDAIQEGRLDSVRCLMPDCTKDRIKGQKGEKQPPKIKLSISPSELLQMGLTEEMVKRYVALKYKTELEADKDTIYCPRQWCNGAARSKKHRKPSGLNFHESPEIELDPADNEPSAEGGVKDATSEKKVSDGKQTDDKKFNRADLLSVCEDCGFAFCSRCLQSWHGEFVICRPKRDPTELTEEEKASLEYISLHTSPCPTCNAPAQKTHGCNHMICSRCNTHFCYLCSAWLDPTNPYRHYNIEPGGKATSCYMRLWELEDGDGDDVGLGFAGGRRPPLAPVVDPRVIEEAARLDEMIRDRDPGRPEHRAENANRPLEHNGRPVAVAREAPLVLRLMGNQPAPARADAQQPAPAPAPAAHPEAVRRGQPAPQRGANRGVQPGGRGARGGGRGAGRRGRGGRNQGVQQQAHARAAVPNNDNNDGLPNIDGLDAAQQAWVRHFVQMALMDEEDQIEGDSDDEDGENWIIR